MDEWIDRVKQGYNTHYGEIKEDKKYVTGNG